MLFPDVLDDKAFDELVPLFEIDSVPFDTIVVAFDVMLAATVAVALTVE